MNPIHIPDDWDDRGLITFEEFCNLIRTPQRTVRDWPAAAVPSGIPAAEAVGKRAGHRPRSIDGRGGECILRARRLVGVEVEPGEHLLPKLSKYSAHSPALNQRHDLETVPREPL